MKTVSIIGRKGWVLAAAAALLLLLCCGAAADGATAYDLWLGGVQVTSANRNDILGDGKAGYDPATHTLTLRSGVTIPGVHEDADSATAKIYAENMPLSVTGTYHMDTAEGGYGVMVRGGTLSLNGSLTFRGTLSGAFSGTRPDFDPEASDPGDPGTGGGAALAGTVVLCGGRDGLRADGNVSLSGSVTLEGGTWGLFALGGITVNADADLSGGQIGAYAHSGDFDMHSGRVCVTGSGRYGLRVNGTARISGAAESLELDGRIGALEAVDLVITNAEGQRMQISEPFDAFFDTGNGTIVQRTGATSGVRVRHALLNHNYILFLGATRVTPANQADIFGDGRAAFDPATNTLTLNDPVIGDILTRADGTTIKLFSANMPLTVTGSYAMPEADVGYGLYTKDGALTMNGTFTFRGTGYGIIAGRGMTVNGGNVSALGGGDSGVNVLDGDLNLAGGVFRAASGNRGANINHGWLVIGCGIDSVSFRGDDFAAIVAYFGITFSETGTEGVYMVNAGRKYVSGQTVYDPDYFPPGLPVYVQIGDEDPIARDVQFASCLLYGLSVSGTRVTSVNAGDILGGGTASYDPDTRTLTLNEPDISGSADDSSGGFNASCSILATGVGSLTVKGQWHQSEPRADIGIRVANGSLVLDGSFNIQGRIAGISADGDLTVESGGTYAYGGEVGAVAHRLAVGSRCGYLELVSSVYAKEPCLFDEAPDDDGWPAGYFFSPDVAGFVSGSISTDHYQRSGVCLVRDLLDMYIPEKLTRVRITDMIGFDGAGSQDDPYLIETADDWNRLAQYTGRGTDLSRKTFALADDIAVTTMIGTSDHLFNAVFDGRGHTLTFTAGNTDNDVSDAPFAWTGGATIRNLRVTGSVTGSRGRASGLIGENRNGVTRVVNCRVSATLSGSFYIAGFCVGEGPGVHFTGCVFDGSITATDKGGGFAGWSERSSGLRFTDCVFAPAGVSYTAAGSGTFFVDEFNSGTQTLANCYFLTSAGAVQGQRAYTVTGDAGVTVGFGAPTAVYDVSGITAFPTGLLYGGVFRAGEGETVTLGLEAEPWDGHALSFAAGTEELTETDGGWVLTMPAGNAVISARRTPTFATGPALRLTCDGSSGGYSSQGADCLFDGLDGTKWCTAFSGEAWVEFRTDLPVLPTACSMTTGGDTARYPGRNPVTWLLQGRESADDGWTDLIAQTDNDHLPPENCVQIFFPLEDAVPCRFFRLKITGIRSGGTMQLSGFSLVGTPVFGEAAFTLPSSLTELGESAFEGMTAMTAVDAGHCTVIGRWAFRNCTGLNRIRLPGTCTIDADAFAGCGTVYIFAQPGGSTEAYCDAHENCVFVAE